MSWNLPLPVDLARDKAVPGAFRCVGKGLSVLCHNISLNPGPGHIRVIRYFIFILARLDAHPATYTFVCVNDEHPPDLRFVRLVCKKSPRINDLDG